MIAWLDTHLPLWRVILWGVPQSERRKVGSCTGFVLEDGIVIELDVIWESEEK